MKTEKFASSREIVFVNTLKFTANTMMAMLFMVLTFCSCSKEVANHHPAQASNLLGSIEETNGLGWAEIDVEANATDANNENLSAAASVRYEGEKEVMVENEEELGLPVTATGDGTTFKTNDNNVITRTENHSASKGVTLNVAGGEWKGGTLGERFERNDSIYQEVLANLSDEAFATTSALPESKIKEWRGSKVSTVRYYRVFVKKAAPVETLYRSRIELVELDEGAYYDLFLEKSTDGGQSWEVLTSWDYFLAIQYGEWKPNVKGSLLVNNYSFETKDSIVEMNKDEDQSSRDGNWKRVNTIAKEYRWCDEFAAPADADGNSIRTIGGAQILKVWKAICTNPETGEEVVFDFNGEITSTHEVNKTTGVYTRTVSINLNGEVIDTQNGSVQLELAQ